MMISRFDSAVRRHVAGRWMLSLLLAAALGMAAAASAAVPPKTVPASAPVAPPVPLLWKVTGAGDARMYLLGSFHLLRKDDYPLAPEADQAFDTARRVVFELSAQDMESPELAGKMVQAAVRTDGSELRHDLGDATWTRLQAYAASNPLPLAQMQGLKPWFVGLSISIAQMQKLGLDPALGLDRHFMDRAAKAGKPIVGLESIDTQIAVLAGMSVAEQRQMVEEALEQSEKGDAEIHALHDAWRRGDDTLMWNRMAVDMKAQYPQLYQRINSDRNDAWLPKLEPWLKAGQGGTLVVVGTLHLLGSDGVVEKLRARGYTVERVPQRAAGTK